MTLSRMQRLLIGFAAMILLAGCNLTDDGKDTVVKVQAEFRVDLFEELKDSRNFQFRLKTIDPQPCINNSIDFTSSRVLSRLNLAIHEIIEAPDCIEGMVPVSAEAGLGFLGIGTYEVQINLKNTIVNEGVLQVTDEAFVLSMSTENGYELVREELRRIPNRYIWGYVAYDEKNVAEQQANNFLSELAGMTSQSVLTKGYYGYFTINDDRTVVFPTAPEQSFFKTFHYQSNGNMNDIKALLDEYRAGGNADIMEIRLYTWDGKVL